MKYDLKFLTKCALIARIENKLCHTSGFANAMDGEVHLTKEAFKACFGVAHTPIEKDLNSLYPYEFGTLWQGTRFYCLSKENHL